MVQCDQRVSQGGQATGDRPAIGPSQEVTQSGQGMVQCGRVTETAQHIPEHLQGLYETAVKECTVQEARDLASLLREFSSTGDYGNDRTHLMTPGITVEPGTRLIRCPPHRLGPEKEEEAESKCRPS